MLTPPPTRSASGFHPRYPPPPALHWLVLLVAVAAAEALAYFFVPSPFREFAINIAIAVWPIYFCMWIRKVQPKSLSLYWALASFATGFLFSWLLWIVVIFEVREELQEHYSRREPIGLRLNFLLTLFFSFVYFQYHMRRIAQLKQVHKFEVIPGEFPTPR